jgi:hypothetical protein
MILRKKQNQKIKIKVSEKIQKLEKVGEDFH